MIALATSAGGLAALCAVLARLPADFPVPVLVLQHLYPGKASHLAELLGRRTPLSVKQAVDGDSLDPGQVYVAPPDAHLVVDADHRLRVRQTPPIRYLRPSIDVLFESLAEAYGSAAVGVVLTGTGHDGAVGVEALKHAGGRVIAQDEASSEYFGMPSSAIETGFVDKVLPLDRIGPALRELAAVGGPA